VRLVYLDNNATTRVAPEVTDAMLPFLRDMWGNPSSMHTFGGQVARHMERAREQVAQILGAQGPDEVVFTSCGTESDNAAIMAALAASPGKKRLVTTKVEHPAVLSLAKHLEGTGHNAVYLPVDNQGRLDLGELKDSIDDNTALVSVMWANNETGVVFPIEEIAKICAERGVPLHTDAVQTIGKIPCDLRNTPITYLAMSGHKLHAPKGVGALYIKRGTKFSPLIMGGHQERNRRGGTENVASIVGMGKACELAMRDTKEECKKMAHLRDRLEKGLMESIPRVHIHGDTINRLPNTTNLGFESVEGEAILLLLNEHNICASSGSACTSGSLDPSHVMIAMGVPFERAHGSIRFSLSRYSEASDVDSVLKHMPPIIKRLRELSPVR